MKNMCIVLLLAAACSGGDKTDGDTEIDPVEEDDGSGGDDGSGDGDGGSDGGDTDDGGSGGDTDDGGGGDSGSGNSGEEGAASPDECQTDDDCSTGTCISIGGAMICQETTSLWYHECNDMEPTNHDCCSDDDCYGPPGTPTGSCAAFEIGYCGGAAPPQMNVSLVNALRPATAVWGKPVPYRGFSDCCRTPASTPTA